MSRFAWSIACSGPGVCVVAALVLITGCDKAPKPTGRDAMNQHSAALMDELDKYANAPADADTPGATIETPTPLTTPESARPAAKSRLRTRPSAPAHAPAHT